MGSGTRTLKYSGLYDRQQFSLTRKLGKSSTQGDQQRLNPIQDVGQKCLQAITTLICALAHLHCYWRQFHPRKAFFNASSLSSVLELALIELDTVAHRPDTEAYFCNVSPLLQSASPNRLSINQSAPQGSPHRDELTAGLLTDQ